MVIKRYRDPQSSGQGERILRFEIGDRGAATWHKAFPTGGGLASVLLGAAASQPIDLDRQWLSVGKGPWQDLISRHILVAGSVLMESHAQLCREFK